MNSDDWWSRIFNFDDYAELLALMQNSLIAAAAVGIMGGLISVVVMTRDMPFAVHGISELSFAGASVGILIGASAIVGSISGAIVAALIIGLLGVRARDRNSITGALMPFGLGVGILALSLYDGRVANKFGLLTGQIVAVDDPQLGSLLTISVIVIAGLLLIWRPLMFASIDPDVAAARGVPTRTMSLAFMLLLGLAVAASIHIVGALLVLSLLVTPAAAALRISSSPLITPLLAMGFALFAAVGGMLLALGSALPISPYITTISFVIYLICRVLGRRRSTRSGGYAKVP